MQLIKPDWPASLGISAFTTTRLGGVSQSPYDALNLGLHVGDEPADVKENRRLLVEAELPAEPHWLNQVHGNGIVRLHEQYTVGDPNNADGAWTDTPGIVLAVMTADCLPLVIVANDGSSVAVVHAGWRGLADGVIASALDCFPEGVPLSVWLGPAIGPDAFEVGEEVRQIFIQCNAKNIQAFRAGSAQDKWWADIYQLASLAVGRHRNAKRGNISINGGNYCTVSDARLFHSHRRDGARSGRMVTLAWMNTRAAIP